MKAKSISRKSHMYKFLDKWGNEFYGWEEYTICEFYFKFISAIGMCSFAFTFIGLMASGAIVAIVSYFYGAYLLCFHMDQFLYWLSPKSGDGIQGLGPIFFILLNGLAILFGTIWLIRHFVFRPKSKVCSIKDIMRKRCKTMVEFTD